MPPFWRKPDHPLPPSLGLIALTAKYEADEHGVYVSAIEAALTGPESKSVRNLALSGGYGVGKSSILGEVARRHKDSVITISLSTLGFADEPTPASGAAKTASSRTNRIQKEIVKQLLYSQDPVKMPGSRYRRMSRFRFWRELGLGALAALPIALTFYLSGWSSSLAGLVRLPADWADLSNLGVYVAAALFVVGVRKVVHNRVHIEKISTSGATIALSAQSATFFDEYVDEIVYFFERTSVDLVILEDIDRFDDAHIFETLRSLNSLLNTAKQLRGRNIRFLYAIKDSIFDQLGQRAAKEELDAEDNGPTEPNILLAKPSERDDAEVELARANRTKFFDQVIPVVPFVTHLSARNLLKNTLDGVSHKVTTDMIDLVGRHIADMRLIKNVRNEFTIFREQLRSTGSLDLSDNGIFAMVLYKSTHLTDFERIKHRQSDLDKLYDDFRDLVNVNIRRLNLQIQQDRSARSKLQAGTAWSKRLGDRLIGILDADLAANEGTMVDRGFSGEPLDDSALRSPSIWDRIANGEAVVLNYNRRIRSMGNYQLTATYSKPLLTALLGDAINPSSWITAERTRLDKRIKDASESVALLGTADMQTLLDRIDFTLTPGSNDTLEHILNKRLGSELARQLVRHGYIDQNFTLHTSIFHAVRVSVVAANFLLKNVDRHRIDSTYTLSPEDVKAVIQETGRSVLDDKSVYNISILDYLLAHDPDGAGLVTRRLAAYGEDEREFLLAYMANGRNRRPLVERLAPGWSGIFPFLINEANLDDELRVNLVDAALQALSEDLDYESGGGVCEFLAANIDLLAAVHSEDASEQQAERIAGYFLGLALVVPKLETVGLNLRAALIRNGGFSVTRENLMLAVKGSPGGIALDELKRQSESIYQRALNDLPNYVSALGETDLSIATAAGMQTVVRDVSTVAPDQLDTILARAAAGIQIADLSTVPPSSWSSLAVHSLFPPTFANVVAYIEEEGPDAALGHLLLSAKEIEVGDGDADEAKRNLARTILTARVEIPPASVRAGLVRSLRLSGHLSPAEVPAIDGELVGWLIGENVIPDDAASFVRISADDWKSRELAISKSASFVDYMTPAVLPTKDIGRLVTSDMVPDLVKFAVVERVAEFVGGSTYQALQQVADFAVSSGRGMSTANLVAVAKYIGINRTLSLLRPHLEAIASEELISILRSAGGEHAKLAGPSGKRPRVDQTDDLDALVRRLQRFGWVSGVDPDGPGMVRVRMGRKAKAR